MPNLQCRSRLALVYIQYSTVYIHRRVAHERKNPTEICWTITSHQDTQPTELSPPPSSKPFVPVAQFQRHGQPLGLLISFYDEGSDRSWSLHIYGLDALLFTWGRRPTDLSLVRLFTKLYPLRYTRRQVYKVSNAIHVTEKTSVNLITCKNAKKELILHITIWKINHILRRLMQTPTAL